MTAFVDGDRKAAEEIMRSHIVDLHSGLDQISRDEGPVSLADALKA